MVASLVADLREQTLPSGWTLECVVVDNDSEDGLRQYALDAGLTYVHIGDRDFSWGRAINLGVEAATGDIVCLMSADVTPVSKRVIEVLCAEASSPDVAAVYARQVPRDDAPIEEVARLELYFGVDRVEANQSEHLDRARWASNACAVFRREVWEAVKFDEACAGAEEAEWLTRAVERWPRVVYEPSAEVFHSHNESMIRSVVRDWDLWQATRRRTGAVAYTWGLARWGVGRIRRRLRAIRYVTGYRKQKMRGIVLIPAETAVWVGVGLTIGVSRSRTRMRGRLWKC